MSELKVGVVGTGGISRSHVPHWIALGAKVSVHSLLGAEELAAQYGVPVVAVLEELFAGVDVVDICTPTATHAALAVAAIEAGKHVVCEKPLGRTLADAQAVAAAARRAQVQVYPAHVVRYFPEYAALHAAVRRGQAGKLAVLRFSRGGSGPTSDWFFDDAESGGIVTDLMIHDLDQARWIAGEVTRVFAVQNPPTVDGRIPRAVTAHVTLVHQSGAISHVHGAWGPPGMEFPNAFDVAGEAATLRYDSRTPRTLVENFPPATEGEPSYLPRTTAEESPYLTEIRELAQAFQGGPAPRVSLDDGVLAVALAEAARRSIDTGEPVDFDAAAVLATQEVGR
ncbi:MAG: Gfo/Idh/MocA family oxidoreductase [Actinocatenispora sp.]